MTVTAIILAHYTQRQGNIKRIIDDLMAGSVVPENICVFIDNPEIEFEDDRAIIIRTNYSFLPRIRFAIGAYFDTDYCFFIDDDLTVRSHTIENLIEHAKRINQPKAILGLQGSILGDTLNPYADDTSIKRQNRDGKAIKVDVVLRTYFVPRVVMSKGFELQALNPNLPDVSLDDMYLCLGNKYLNNVDNYVVSINEKSDVSELSEAGVGQSFSGKHYENRNKVARKLMDKYVILSA